MTTTETKTTLNVIAPCLWCGGKAMLDSDQICEHDHIYWIVCKDDEECHARSFGKHTAEAAIAAHNILSARLRAANELLTALKGLLTANIALRHRIDHARDVIDKAEGGAT